MMVNLSTRALIVVVALGFVGSDQGKDKDDAKPRGLTDLLGLGAKKHAYTPNALSGPFGYELPAAPSDTIKFKVYTVKSVHTPLVVNSASKLKKNDKKFSPGARVKMLITDWTYEDGTQLVPAQNIKNEYISQKRTENIIIVDWSGIGMLFEPEKAVDLAKKAAKKITEFINAMIKEELMKGLGDLDIIGLGGGAQVAGIIANRLKKNNTAGNIARITGLDPTGPGFEEAHDDNKLDSSDADFVDIMHCNRPEKVEHHWFSLGGGSAGKERYMGIKEAAGTMDTFLNGGTKQPGCEGFLGHYDSCSHTRCFDVFALTIKGLELHGCECEDWATFNTGSCDCKDGPLIGDPTPSNVTGQYFVKTDANANTKVKPKKSKSKDKDVSEEKEGKGKKEKSEEEKDED